MSYLKELQDRYKAARARMQANAKLENKTLPNPMLVSRAKENSSKHPRAGLVPEGADHALVTEALKQANPEWIGGNHAQAIKIANEMVSAPKLPPLPGLVLNEAGAVRWLRVLHAVAAYHEIDPSEILSTSRKRHVIRARFEVFYRLRVDLNFSYPKIAQLMKKDHTTVLHGVTRMRQMVLDGLVQRDNDSRSPSVTHLTGGDDAQTLNLAAV